MLNYGDLSRRCSSSGSWRGGDERPVRREVVSTLAWDDYLFDCEMLEDRNIRFARYKKTEKPKAAAVQAENETEAVPHNQPAALSEDAEPRKRR